MANHLAIATATEALRLRLSAAVQAVLDGADVVSRRPESTDGQAGSTVTVFLYRVTPNAALRNADLPTRSASDGRPRRRPRAALDLHYLLSFSGDEQELVPQRMLGACVASLHSAPELRREELTVATQGESWLFASDLANEIESVKFSMAALSLEDFSKIWSVFFQVPYRLSMAFEASLVLIEADVPVRVPLPVRRDGVDALPLGRPVIEGIMGVGQRDGAAGMEGGPDLQIQISGRHLRGADTFVQFDGGALQRPDELSDRRLTVSGAALAAGVHGMQVVHTIMIGDPRQPHRGAVSETVPFVVRPVIIPARDLVDDASGGIPDPARATLDVSFVPSVQPGQRVLLLLDEYSAQEPAGRALRSYRLEPETLPAQPAARLRFRRGRVAAGTYLVRAQVDGAESLLDLKMDSGNGPMPEPQVVAP